MQKNKLLYLFGNIFIVISLLGFIYTFYPLFKIYFFPSLPPENTQNINRGFYLSIPKINAYSRVITDVDPWKEAIYNEALKNGVAHARGSAKPGQGKTIYLFAHSSGSPWEITHLNTVFLRLGELNSGDKIRIDYKGKKYLYTVFAKKEIKASDTKFIKNLDKDILILQTCSPIGTALNRLLIFAKVN